MTVEHACQQCGTVVEDGRPFCPQCRAPQIHVQAAVPDSGVAADVNSAPGGFSPEILQAGHPDRPGVMNRGIAVRAALKAGALGVFIAMIPLLGIVLTGALAVFFYRRQSGSVLPATLGMRLGGAAGVVVFAINALFTIAIIALHAQQKCVDAILQLAEKYGVNTATPQFQASIRNMFTASGLATFFVVALVLSSAGGALATLFLRPRPPRA